MTASNRFMNRLFLVVTGLITLIVGVALVVAAIPGVAGVHDALTTARDSVATAVRDTPLSGFGQTGGSYLAALLAVLCLIVVVVALIAAFTRGRGRIDRVIEEDEPQGEIVISSKFAENAIVDALSDRRDVAGVSVSAWRLKKQPALKVRVRVTAGSSPKPVVDATSSVVRGLDAVLGRGASIPVLVEVVGASAVRPGADSRVA